MLKQADAREGQRIAKVMARAGLCSRRDAEQWIAEGRVSVNGEVLASPAFNVGDADEIHVDGEPLRAPERTRLFLFHKPRGLVTTAKDPEGRRTIFDALPQDLPRVVAVGRLDINTEGLLLLTNDGGLARVLELPATGWLRRYRVRAHGEITQERLDGLRDGVSIDGVDYRGIEARFERQQGSNVWLTMGLREGKNREIKRVLEHMGLSVNRLIRVSFGPFELADLAEGDVTETRTRVLRDQLGPKLARQAGANFDAAEEPAVAIEPPGGERPSSSPRAEPMRGGERREDAPRKRKHVSVMRAEARAGVEGPRKRIARATTADRKGREVAVERVSLANPPPPPRQRRPAPRRGFGENDAAPPRTFREGHARPDRPPRADGGERRSRDAAPPRTFRERPARPDRPPRADGGERRSRDAALPRTFREGHAKPDRSPRANGGERRSRDAAPPRTFREGHARPDRPPRADGGERRSRDAAPPRTFRERPAKPDRSPRGDGGERRSRDAAPPRTFREGHAKPDRSPRGDGGERRSRDAAPPRTFRERPAKPERSPRGDGGERRSRDAAPPRTFRERPAKPERSPRGDGGERRSRDAAPPRTFREGHAKPERSPRKDGERPARGPANEGPRSRDGGRPPRGKGPPRGGNSPRGR